MKSLTLPQVIPSMSKFYQKIITIGTLKDHIQQIAGPDLKDTQIYKIIYHLKTKGYIISCKKDLFYIKSPNTEISEEELISQRYRRLLSQHCRDDCTTNRYIGGMSALEGAIGLSYINTDEVIIINDTKTAVEVVCFDKNVLYKTYRSADTSLFKQSKKHTQIISVPGAKIKIAALELALLEALYSPVRNQQTLIQQTAVKLLKKHKKALNWSVFESMIKTGKFHSSFNRLLKISKEVDPLMYQRFGVLIKKYSYMMDV